MSDQLLYQFMCSNTTIELKLVMDYISDKSESTQKCFINI